MAEQTTNSGGQRRRRQQSVDNTYAHVQPQATEIERAVLGALMIDKDAYAVICEMLNPESFYEPRIVLSVSCRCMSCLLMYGQ